MNNMLKMFGKAVKGYSQERDLVMTQNESEWMEIDKVIYVDEKNQNNLKFKDDLDSDEEIQTYKKKIIKN